MMVRRRGAWLVVASLLAACGARSGVLVDDGSTDFGASGASAGQSGIRTAGAPGRAGAPFGGAPSAGAPFGGAPSAGAPFGGAPSAGAPFGGAPSAGAPGAGGGPTTACTPDGSNCPNGFACVAGSCLTKCESLEQCRPDRFCAEGSACPLRAKHIAAGVSDTCAVLVDDSVRCWGDGDAGQLGDGLANTSTTPVTVKAVAGAASGIDQIELGVLFACAVTALGQGSCWGAGDLGQLGAGTLDASSTPVPTLGSGPMGETAAGRRRTLSRLRDLGGRRGALLGCQFRRPARHRRHHEHGEAGAHRCQAGPQHPPSKQR